MLTSRQRIARQTPPRNARFIVIQSSCGCRHRILRRGPVEGGLSVRAQASSGGGLNVPGKPLREDEDEIRTPPVKLNVLFGRFVKLARPFWIDNPDRKAPLLALAGVLLLSLMTTAVSVTFNFMGRDFMNYLAAKDVARFQAQLIKYFFAFVVGIPVFILRDYFLGLLTLRWRDWMTEKFLESYMANRTFYNIHNGKAVDNPDQRISADVTAFTSTSLSLVFTFLTSFVDLLSFAGILFSIYKPLFAVLVVYAVGGTIAAYAIGKKLVGLNFEQEAREADFRYGLVRVRENAEAIAFYKGGPSEVGVLTKRLRKVVSNYRNILGATRDLGYFQMMYRHLIILLPTAVVAPLYFKGAIEMGVVSQASSAFGHILEDVSLVVSRFDSLAGFSAVVERLGQFQEATLAHGKASDTATQHPALTLGEKIELVDRDGADGPVVALSKVTIATPDYSTLLVRDLDVELARGGSILVEGPSGCGKTSMLRVIGGLWDAGRGRVTRPPGSEALGDAANARGMLLVPQKPYMVLGSLRQQLLYPVFSDAVHASDASHNGAGMTPSTAGGNGTGNGSHGGEGGEGADTHASNASNGAGVATEPPQPPPVDDAELLACMRMVGLGEFLDRLTKRADTAEEGVLAEVADWASEMSLGEQQRIAFARVLLANPSLVLLDESTSALDPVNEERLYGLLRGRGMAFVSVGHRTSLRAFHDRVINLSEASQTAT